MDQRRVRRHKGISLSAQGKWPPLGDDALWADSQYSNMVVACWLRIQVRERKDQTLLA